MMDIDLDNLPAGTKVKIVDKWRYDNGKGLQNSMGEMDEFLGEYLTISDKDYGDYYSLEGEAGQWSWSPELFDAVKLPDMKTWFLVGFSPLLDKYVTLSECAENLVEEELEVIAESMESYYVFVSGKSNPKRIHNSYEAAEKEAKRLAEKLVGCVVSICKIEKQFISRVIVEEVD